MKAHLDHIGIAVRPDSRLHEALRVLGLPVTGSEEAAREKVKVDWVPLPREEAHVELLRPAAPDGTIQKFLDKSGRDGVHHLSFRVGDVRAAMKALEAAGFRMIYSEPRPGAHGCLVNFIHPQTTGGVLLEITEKS